jgi:CRISPR-associated protein Cst2
MRGNIMINTSCIGNEIDEYTYEVKEILSTDEKNQRLNILLDAIKNFNGGAKQARNLEDISPKFIVIASQKTGNPFLLNTLSVDTEGNINIENIKEAINEQEVGNLTIGISKGIFTNEDEIKNSFDNVVTVGKAIEEYKDLLKSQQDENN